MDQMKLVDHDGPERATARPRTDDSGSLHALALVRTAIFREVLSLRGVQPLAPRNWPPQPLVRGHVLTRQLHRSWDTSYSDLPHRGSPRRP